MSGDPNDKSYERAELERFAAQRGLPEAVLAQLRSRAKNEISTAADGTFKVPTLKRVGGAVDRSLTGGTTAPTPPVPSERSALARSQSAVVIGSQAISIPHSSTLPAPRLSVEDASPLSVSPPITGTNAPAAASLHEQKDQKPNKPKPVAPLALDAINPVHRMPFNLESHTQQGADEYHAEENQDRHCFGFDHSRRLAWMGISDGHCGAGAADFVATSIVRNVSSCLPKGPPPSVDELIAGIKKGVFKTEESFRKVQDGSGACLLLACLWEDMLVVANVGDSRAVIGSNKAGAKVGTLLTNDHNAINPVEAKLARFRFLRNQGLLKGISDPQAISAEELIRLTKEAMDGDDIIVNGRLFSTECTRTIGDFGLKKACFDVITWEPEFSIWKMTEADSTLILGCDGVWRTIDAQRAVEIVMKTGDESPAQKLVKAAVAEGSGDDQTCLVLDLMHYRSCLSSNTDLASRIFKGLSVFDNNTAQALASSAHRTFSAKLARLHKTGSLGAGQTVSGMFEQHAKKTQTMASSVHRESRGKFDRAAAPAPYAGLSLFEQKPKAAPAPTAPSPAPRRLAQSSLALPTETPVAASSALSKSTDDTALQHHSRASSAGSPTTMHIEVTLPLTIDPPSISITTASSSSAPSLSVLSRSQSSPQIDPDRTSPTRPPSSPLPFALQSCRLEDAQPLLAELRVGPVSVPNAQLFTITSSQATAGLLIATPVHYGLTSDSATLRLSLCLLPAHKSAYVDLFGIAAMHLFTSDSFLARLEYCVASVNMRECKALEDASWRREGLLRGALLTDAGRRDAVLYSILRSDL